MWFSLHIDHLQADITSIAKPTVLQQLSLGQFLEKIWQAGDASIGNCRLLLLGSLHLVLTKIQDTDEKGRIMRRFDILHSELETESQGILILQSPYTFHWKIFTFIPPQAKFWECDWLKRTKYCVVFGSHHSQSTVYYFNIPSSTVFYFCIRLPIIPHRRNIS